MSSTEAYLDMIGAVEQTAAALQLPVVIEGSPPPHDPRLNSLKVTPDPGVVEVNLQPAPAGMNWLQTPPRFITRPARPVLARKNS